MTFTLVPVPVLSIEPFAAAAGLHPELVRRLVTLGLLEANEDDHGELWFAASQVSAAARIRRLRAGLSLNYAAVGLVTELLDRIAELEAALQMRPNSDGGRT
jgi:chaperone modulatory protein CbpM